MSKICVYPGTFDPVHLGHIDIVRRALNIFETVVVAIAENPKKKPLFSIKERVDLFQNAVKEFDGRVIVESFEGLLVDFMKKYNTKICVRGVRLFTDFEYELQIAMTNYKLDKVETFFMMPSQDLIHISSTIVKDIAFHFGSLDGLVTEYTAEALRKKVREVLKK
ncbi:pantetheine-phosphate adenylyltransferase [Venenivibrio stagnispumantis]|uniref:Phosphopantetheine adenylyltransferase n=1 Tax=Venenivibrio stagnispumantis TaxID=407998 RepID=A0AA45WKY9_9AQUI|nr:pantetheine-phosphate adenylyltransferase [Venenivibrio stagnispumantis]MCW4573113.1 pantetheine-phosphate adenylyltransferase [Venenivibrio stagnispumantis]SMP09017.1 Phosphopantetheine adenylyltransferase [Venenivibrio stagnispumantis]